MQVDIRLRLHASPILTLPLPFLNLPTPRHKISNMPIPTLPTETQQRLLQIKKILPILATRAPGLQNLPRQRTRLLGPQELRVLGQADVDQAFDWGGVWGGGGLEGCELDAVPVDLADVEVLAHFGDLGRGDVVCGAPDAFSGFVLGGSAMGGGGAGWEGGRLTWSVKVAQCARSMSVTTRPGSSGVPLWSSLLHFVRSSRVCGVQHGSTLPRDFLVMGWCGEHGNRLPTCQNRRT